MAFTTTWSFGSGYDGWTYVDDSTANASTSRSHVSGAIRTNLQYANVAGVRTAIANHTSPVGLNATIQNGDTIELDYGSSSDGKIVRIRLRGYYTDGTNEEVTVVNTGSGTLTLTLTQAKTLDYIFFLLLIGSSVTPDSRNTNRDVTEIRLTTNTELTPTPGLLRNPTDYINDQGDGADGGAGGGAGGNIADISADGLYIYIASFNNLGQPTLIRMPALLSADGTVVFEPGAGGRIGVQAGELNAGMIWVAGSFDGTNTVEKSEDYGATWTVKDDGIFGTVRTFQVGPGDDERVLVFDGDNGDILETVDDGETWTTINAAVSPLINSLARLSVDLQEIVAGNQGDVTDSINYSPNSGVNLEDYQTGVYPNADATKVQVT